MLVAGKISSINQQQLINPAIYYHMDGYNTNGNKLMGRQVAGESFLKAYCEYTSFPVVNCFTVDSKMAQDFNQKVLKFSRTEKNTKCIFPHMSKQLEDAGCMFIPGPDLEDFAWQRRHFKQTAYSLCGITHTTSSDRAMKSIGSLLTAPVQPWDALICTSKSVKSMVQVLLDDYQEYLVKRMGSASVKNPVQLPVIPLGVSCKDLRPTPAKKRLGRELRKQHGLGDDTVVFLFVGRLSFHAKAHPYPMFIALEQAAQRTGRKLALILAGWFSNSEIQKSFKETAALTCPSVPVFFVDGRNPDVRETIWYAADVFTSLSDNIQETFGLTPIEAKSAGLPVVVSDWDGYRETVAHGKDGFLIPTIMPGAGNGLDLAFEYACETYNYDHYIGRVSQTTAIDIESCIQAYTQLIENQSLRQLMGQAASQDARSRFDWPVIIQAYQELWIELSEIRVNSEEELAPLAQEYPPNPLCSDPYRLFQAYPSKQLEGVTRVAIANLELNPVASQLSVNRFAMDMLCPINQINAILQTIIAKQPIKLEDLARIHNDIQTSRLFKTIGWLLKMGVICIYN